MSRQELSLKSLGGDVSVVNDELQHILIPACALGVDGYRQFCAANPDWRPELHGQGSGSEKLKKCPSCRECLANISKQVSLKTGLIIEGGSGPTKVSKPMALPITNAKDKLKSDAADQAISFQVIKPQDAATEEPGVMTILVRPTVREVAMEDREPRKKATTIEEHASGSKTQCIGVITPAGLKSSEPKNVDSRMDTMSVHTTSSQELSESTMTPSRMEAENLPDHEVGHSPGNANSTPLRADTPMLVDDQEKLFDYIVSTRNVPNGGASLPSLVVDRLQQHFKTYCPPCPHCNSNTYVKFRYFNNFGKSNLLQPRYTCRNPDTCVTVQEKSGRAGSRDFTFPKPKEGEFPAGHSTLRGVGQAELLGRVVRQPAQVLPRARNKRPAHELNSLAEMGERSSKFPNTTLTLQTLNGAGPVIAHEPTMPLAEISKEREISLVKPHTEDTHSSSSTRTASDQHPGINVQYRAEASSENGRLVVQPISFQKVASISNKGEAITIDGSKAKGKIAELNICMYIDLSATSSS